MKGIMPAVELILNYQASKLGQPQVSCLGKKRTEDSSFLECLVDACNRAEAMGRDGKLSNLHFFGGFPAKTHLVLSCDTREREMEESVSRFSCLGLDRLVLNKLAETATCGNMLNMFFLWEFPISYLPVGQKVQEDIREGTPKIIADLVFSMTPLRQTEGAVRAERQYS